MSSECVAGGSIIPVTGAKRERQRVHRTILTICYAGALRVSEAIRLTVADIDSSEWSFESNKARGRKDCAWHYVH